METQHHLRALPARLAPLGLIALALMTQACLDSDDGDDNGGNLPHTLYVAHSGGELVGYDIATGEALPGKIPDMGGPSDMQALEDGTILVNLTDNNQILAFDGKTMIEKARLPSSTIGATRPVHSYITNPMGGKRYWVAMNDGGGTAATNSARFVQIGKDHADYLKAVGEVPLGVGHHKAAWSRSKERAVISSIGDLNDVFTVIDYSDPANIQRVKTWSAKDLGRDSGAASPHGCGMAKASGKGYCSMTGPGWVAAVDMDATPPAVKVIKTAGSGGGYTSADPSGRYVYSLQTNPREGAPGGKACQVGQIAVIDATTDSLVKELPLFRTGPDCTESIAGTDEKTAGPGHIVFTPDGKKAYVGMASGFTDPNGRTRVQLALDVTDPANPKQLASVPVGASLSHHADLITGDGKYVFVANNQDATVTQIDAATGRVVRTFPVQTNPKALATFGDAEGPSHQAGPVE